MCVCVCEYFIFFMSALLPTIIELYPCMFLTTHESLLVRLASVLYNSAYNDTYPQNLTNTYSYYHNVMGIFQPAF